MSGTSAYQRLGAAATKDDVHAAVAGADPGLFPTAFCKLGPDVLGDDPEWCAALHADGAGTTSISCASIWRASTVPTPCMKGSPEASTQT